ncbi:MAG TPA: MFS transporter, partial [Nitrososphaerales archaeon]|nr:MFS transporter [Nitrososphaerales archaeon]
GGAYAYKNWFNSRDDPNKIGIGRDALKLLRKKRMILLGLFALLATWSSVWQVVFLPYYFNKVLGLSVALAAFASTIVTISGGAGKITLGWASDRWKRNWLLAGLSLVVVLSYLLFFSSSASVLLLLASVLMGFFSAAIFPILQSLVVDTSKDRPGTALGISTTAQSIATVMSPIIAASLFSLGVGKAIAYDAMIPAVISIPVAIALNDIR